MFELADIFRTYGPAYRQRYGDRMLPRHIQVMWDIAHCRTPIMGGACYYCPQCQTSHYSYHSCHNRHCPQCASNRADRWRERQLAHLLPVPYFLVTCTLPHTLNPLARSHQKLIYTLLFKTSADALQTLARNPQWLGGTIGMVGVLHTWDRSLGYHLHVHYLMPAGGIDPTTGAWTPSHPKFLIPGSALRTVFRATFRDALQAVAPDLFAQVPSETWTTQWVVHCQPVGDGRTALKYLAPYVYRVALSNRRLVSLQDGQVTFRYKPRQQPWKTMTLDALAFMQRFLQHVLPKGFQKVRSFGFLHPSHRARFTALQAHLTATATAETAATVAAESPATDTPSPHQHSPDTPGVCPQCGSPLQYLGRLPRSPRGPP
jgi:hypothetical protein